MQLHDFVIAFAAGTLIGLFVSESPVILACAGAAAAAMLASSFPSRSRRRAMACGLTVGMLYTAMHVHFVQELRLPSGETPYDTRIVGEVTTFARRLDHLTRVEFSLLQPLHEESVGYVTPRGKFYGIVRLNCYRCVHEFEPGQTWTLAARLRGIHGLANPGVFDYERWAFQRRLVASGTVIDDEQNRLLQEPDRHFLSPWLRTRFERFLARHVDAEAGLGIVRAITLGDRQGIDSTAWEIFRRTGTGHLVAISGLHVSLVFAFLYGAANLLLRLFPPLLVHGPAQRIAACLALPPTLYYAWLAGFSLPTQRAATMLAVFWLAYVFGRRVVGWHSFAVALLLVLLVDPLAPLSQGSWLSFGAVAAIILYAGRTRSAARPSNVAAAFSPEGLVHGALRRFGRLVAAWVGVQVAVSMAVLPLGGLFFGELSLVSMPVNLLAIPLFGIGVVAPALLGIFAWLVGAKTPAEMLVLLAGDAAQVMYEVLGRISEFPFASLSVAPVDVLRIVSSIVVITALRIPRARSFAAITALGALLAVVEAGAPRRDGEFEAVVLDVGQGLSIVIRTRRHALIFDTGIRFGDSYDMGEMVINPFLRRRGIDDPDILVISHGDRDHAGGADAVIRAHPGLLTLTSGPDIRGVSGRCREGMGWTLDGVRFRFLGPPIAPPGSDNDRSCVLMISSPNGRLLLPGDIEAAAERGLVSRYGAGLRADALVVPHHGSKTSSTTAFLAAVSATIAILPRGLNNPFGHPHPTVVERLQKTGIRILDTGLDGAVTLAFSKEGIEWQTHRGGFHPPWRSLPRGLPDSVGRQD